MILKHFSANQSSCCFCIVLTGRIQVISLLYVLVIFSFPLVIFNLANGYGFIFASILAALRGYTGPTEASGFELDRHLSYCYVTVRPPSGGFFSSVSVETPFMTYTDHFKRVSIQSLKGLNNNISFQQQISVRL